MVFLIIDIVAIVVGIVGLIFGTQVLAARMDNREVEYYKYVITFVCIICMLIYTIFFYT